MSINVYGLLLCSCYKACKHRKLGRFLLFWFNQRNNFWVKLCLSRMECDEKGKLVSWSQRVLPAAGCRAALRINANLL